MEYMNYFSSPSYPRNTLSIPACPLIVNRPRHPLYMESLYNKRNPCHDVIVNLVIKVPKLGNNPEPVASSLSFSSL